MDDAGGQLGIMDIKRALELAEERGLDLVEVSPNATPPVCRLMDYGKFKYQQQKKSKEAKKNQQTITVKEIKLRPQTNQHDLDTKIRHIRRFIGDGDKVKLNVFFRGREIAHPELAEVILKRVVDTIKDIAKIESHPQMEGRRMIMIVAPAHGDTSAANTTINMPDKAVLAAAAAAAANQPSPRQQRQMPTQQATAKRAATSAMTK